MHNPTRLTATVVDSLAIMYESGGALQPGYFGQPNPGGLIEVASVNAEGFLGVIHGETNVAHQDVPIVTEGKAEVYFDTSLAEGGLAKIGSSGRASYYSEDQIVVQNTTGTDGSFAAVITAPSVLTIAQAVDVEADRGRVIRVIGSDAGGDGIYEDITLNSVDSSTGVDGTVEFTIVSGAYTVDGAVLGAQDVTISDDGANLVTTIVGASAEIGADNTGIVPETCSNIIDVVGPNADVTFVSLVGYPCDDPDTLTVERLQLDGGSPSFAETSAEYRQIVRICTGELSNGEDALIRTDAHTDTGSRMVGRVVTGADYKGKGVIQVKA